MSEPTEIVLGKSKGDLAIAEAIDSFLASTKAAKEAEMKAGIAKEAIRHFADKRWIKLYSGRGVLPSTPFKIVTAEGKSVNYVVQDKTDGAELKAEAVDELRALLDDAGSLVEESISLELDRSVMKETAPSGSRVGDLVAARLATLAYELETTGLLSRDQAQRVFRIRPIKQLKPSLLGRLPGLVANSAEKIAEVLSVLSGSVVRFIRA